DVTDRDPEHDPLGFRIGQLFCQVPSFLCSGSPVSGVVESARHNRNSQHNGCGHHICHLAGWEAAGKEVQMPATGRPPWLNRGLAAILTWINGDHENATTSIGGGGGFSASPRAALCSLP